MRGGGDLCMAIAHPHGGWMLAYSIIFIYYYFLVLIIVI